MAIGLIKDGDHSSLAYHYQELILRALVTANSLEKITRENDGNGADADPPADEEDK